jgi:NAD-dependent SIR2 family protein deacetylase
MQAVSLYEYNLLQLSDQHLTVPDYRSSSRSKGSSRRVYDSSAYSSLEAAGQLNSDILSKLQNGQQASFTSFDLFAQKLAESGRLRHHYTQNMDCRQARLPCLAERTIWLHGRADTMICHMNPTHTKQVSAKSFTKLAMAPCPYCKRLQKQRTREGRRPRSVGFLRPKVLLYGEDCPDESAITAAFKEDLREPVDAVLIVGTRLSIPSVLEFAKRLSKTVRARDPDNMVVWVNKEPPKLGARFKPFINYEHRGDCDAFASLHTG